MAATRLLEGGCLLLGVAQLPLHCREAELELVVLLLELLAVGLLLLHPLKVLLHTQKERFVVRSALLQVLDARALLLVHRLDLALLLHDLLHHQLVLRDLVLHRGVR